MAGIYRALQALFGNRLRVLEESGRSIQSIGRVRFGPRSVLLVNSPELVQELFIDRAADFQKGPAIRVISRPLLGDGLLSAEGEQHRRQRRLVAPAFAHQRISRYSAVMERHARRAMDAWADGWGDGWGPTIDIAREMMRLTLGIVGETLFDTDLLADADSLAADVTAVQRHAARQLRTPFKLPIPGRVQAAGERLNDNIYRMIRDRRVSGRDHGDLLSMLLLSVDEETGSL